MKQTKREAPHTPEAMKAGKELMVTALGKGMGPGDAAEMLGLGRSTVYEWKREDTEFSAKWEEAVETSLDRLETVSYNLALGGDPRMIEWNLKWRMRGVYNDSSAYARTCDCSERLTVDLIACCFRAHDSTTSISSPSPSANYAITMCWSSSGTRATFATPRCWARSPAKRSTLL
jgi:hypothetical protein